MLFWGEGHISVWGRCENNLCTWYSLWHVWSHTKKHLCHKKCVPHINILLTYKRKTSKHYPQPRTTWAGYTQGKLWDRLDILSWKAFGPRARCIYVTKMCSIQWYCAYSQKKTSQELKFKVQHYLHQNYANEWHF